MRAVTYEIGGKKIACLLCNTTQCNLLQVDCNHEYTEPVRRSSNANSGIESQNISYEQTTFRNPSMCTYTVNRLFCFIMFCLIGGYVAADITALVAEASKAITTRRPATDTEGTSLRELLREVIKKKKL